MNVHTETNPCLSGEKYLDGERNTLWIRKTMGLYHILQLQIQTQNMPLFPVYVYTHKAKFPLSASAAWAFLAVFRTSDTGILSLLFQRQSTGLLLVVSPAFPTLS